MNENLGEVLIVLGVLIYFGWVAWLAHNEE